MSRRTLIPAGTLTDVDRAIERFEDAMRQKPPKKAKPTSAQPAQKERRETFRPPTQHELFVAERIAHGTKEAEERHDLFKRTG